MYVIHVYTDCNNSTFTFCITLNCMFLQEELLPNPIGIEPSNSEDYNKYMSILEDLVKLDSINKTLHELVESEIPESYKDHLKGFKIIIHEVLIDACNWVSVTMFH